MNTRILILLLTAVLFSPSALAQTTRSPTDTIREFYRMMREKKYREAFGISIYRQAIEGLSTQEFEDLKPDFDRMAVAVSEKIPEKIDITGEQISGDAATVFVKVLDPDGKEKIEPASLIKIDNSWIVGDKENLELVRQAGKKFFFEARINAHHDDVQEMLTRISLAQVAYSQSHNGQFGNTAELIAAGFIPKDIEGTETTGYRFQVMRAADAKSWYATAEPAQYGRTGRLSFYLDASGVRSGDAGGKPLPLKN
jgi:Sec-independent protein translocase protein TatA